MSTELKASLGHPMSLTRYWGGDDKGAMIQVTGPNCDSEIGYIGLSRAEAISLAIDLLEFGVGRENAESD